MRFRAMQNTTIFCLKRLDACGWLNPATVARDRWPNSGQPLKKIATIRKHLDILAKRGFATRVGDYYRATDAGKTAAGMASEQQRPLMLGLA